MFFRVQPPKRVAAKLGERTCEKKFLAFAFLLFLAFSSAQGQQSLILGSTYTFIFYYKNTGNVTMNQVTYLIPLPSELAYVDCSGPPCADGSAGISWNLGSLTPSQSGYVTFSAYVSTCSTN